MDIYAIADLHLAISTPDKTMEVFGLGWSDYQNRIKNNWEKIVKQQDLVLLPGDITWAMNFEDALIDLRWIDKLPGKKIMIKGNHDYWWPSNKKLSENLPSSINFIHNNYIQVNEDLVIGGTRLWDDPSFNCDDIIDFIPSPLVKEKHLDQQKEEKTFEKELMRLENSLKLLPTNAKIKICMTHYPPLPPSLQPTRGSSIIEKYDIDYCLFGHLHNVHTKEKLFGRRKQTDYIFVAADYLEFVPKKILSV